MAKKLLQNISVQQDTIPQVDKYSDRANDISTKEDSILERLNVDLITHDDAILYYINNIIKPQIVQNGTIIKVPTIIGNQEVWKAIQTDGYYRDKNDKILVPIIVLNRDSITPNRDFINKVDGNVPLSQFTFNRAYSEKNIYDRFSKFRKPQIETYTVTVPDYLTITYNGIILTNFVENMNKIVESLLYSSNSYWGKPNSFSFKTNIESFSDSSDISVENERLIKTDFSLTIHGHIVPSVQIREINQVGKKYTPTSIKITETVVPL